MTPEQLLNFLTQRWAIVVQFFNELFPQVASIIPNFFSILSQQINAATNAVYSTLLVYVNNVRIQLQAQISAMTALINYQSQATLQQSLAFTLEQVNNLRAFMTGRLQYLQGYAEYNLAKLEGSIKELDQRTKYEIAKLNSILMARIEGIDSQFQKIVHIAHFDQIDALNFLGYFMKYPRQVIADILLDIIFSLLLHEIGRGLISQDEPEEIRPDYRSIPGYPKEDTTRLPNPKGGGSVY